jgi:hypothetical protein
LPLPPNCPSEASTPTSTARKTDEGWADFKLRLEDAFDHCESEVERFRLLIDSFLPELLADVSFIQILLTEGVDYTRIEEKTGELSAIIASLVNPMMANGSSLRDFSSRDIEAAMLVYFLGVLGAVRICESAGLDLTSSDVLAFLRKSIRNGLGVEL